MNFDAFRQQRSLEEDKQTFSVNGPESLTTQVSQVPADQAPEYANR
jgi:hypothetical protein